MEKETQERKGYIRPTGYEILTNEVTDSRVIQLTVNEQPLICLPIEMLAVRTFFRSILARDHPEKLVHDVILNTVSALKGKIKEVSIYDLIDDHYLAKMLLLDASGNEHVIELEASDAFAIAFKAPCYVYIAEKLLKLRIRNRLHWYDTYAPNLCERLREIDPDSFVMYPEYDLSLFIQKAIEEEDYELAELLKKAMERKK
jgi:bifunctional DNase/RNase